MNRKTIPPTKRVATGRAAVALILLTGSAVLAQQAQIALRPLTHQEIHDYHLPEGTQVSGGLTTVGVGSAVYLEAQMLKNASVSNVTWTITSKPDGSTATLAESPLPPELGIFEPSDRLDYQIADRQLLVPDKEGQYTIQATVTTDAGDTVLTRNITSATYLGAANSCILCHSGGFLPDKYTPWSKTGHADMFTRGIDGVASSHYNEDCIQCHTVGYDTAPTAKNGGFDDVADELGWTFPDVLTNGNWAALPVELKSVSNIQCENCHGPGMEHAISLGKKSKISVSFGLGDCAQCHAEQPYHVKPQEWENSKHAVAVREERAGCAGCHQGPGFVDRMNGVSPVRTEYSPITCAACHDPHDATNPHQLRGVGSITLNDTSKPGGPTVITNAGTGAICMNCHMGRRDAVTYVEGTGNSHFGPHHGPQADMLAGVNAFTYGKNIPSSGHRHVVKDSCVKCHLQATARTSPAHLKVGGHTFNPRWDGGTPEDPSDDVHLVGACIECHGPITSFDIARQDYDGNGVIEGVQTEVEGLLHELAMMLPPIGEPTVAVTAAYTKPQLKAVFNYLFVEEDGSKGVHNTAYAVGLLKASIADLKDDADNDGLSDTWEIANFGSITAQNALGDADGDGLNNALELAAGLNPNSVDSDNDGFNDKAEMMAGSDPLNAQDKPGMLVKVYTAAELEFASEVGKTYQLQSVSEITGSWQDVGLPIPGTGELISHLISARSATAQYYRVKVLP